MEMAYAILATAAHMEADGRLFLMNGGLDHINVTRDLQQPLSPLYLAGKVVFLPEECGREREIQIDLIGPTGEVVEQAPTNRIRLDPPTPPSRVSKSAFLLQFAGVPFRESGRYTFRISVDGQTMTDVDVNVTITDPP